MIEPGELSACPPIVWSSPTKYYPGKERLFDCASNQAAPQPAGPVQRQGLTSAAPVPPAGSNPQSSRALLILQERLVHAGESSKRQLAEAAVAFQRQLADVQAAAASKADSLQEQLVQQCRRRQEQRLLSTCVSAWRYCRHKEQKQKQQAQLLALVLQAWQQVSACNRAEQQELRTTCLHGWLLLAKHTAAAARRVEALQRRWAHRLLMAWLQHSTAAQALALQAVLRADRWHNRRSLHMCYSSWKQGCHIKQQLVQGYTGQRQAVLLSRAMQEWHHCAQQQRSAANQQLQQQASDAAAYSQQLQRAWVMLRQQLSAGQQQARRHRERHLLQAAVGAWVALPSTHLRLRAIAAAVSSVYDQLLLGWGLRAFCSCCSEAVAARRSVRQCIRLWGQVTAASATQRHLIRARAAARRRSVLQACFSYWLRAAWTTCRQAAALQAGELQAALVCSEAHATARQSQLDCLTAHQQALLQLVQAAASAAVPEPPLVPALHWHYLAAAGTTQQLVQPRARHAAFALSALQPQQPALSDLHQLVGGQQQQQHGYAGGQGATSAACSANSCSTNVQEAPGPAAKPPAGLLGCLAVFGGVTAGGSWLHDVTLVLMSDDSSSQGRATGCCVDLLHVPPSTGCEVGSGCSGDISSSSSAMPVWVCDFAACECGPDSFVVVGGFDGSRNSLMLQRCVLTQGSSGQHTGAAPDAASGVAESCATPASGAAARSGAGSQLPTSHSWAQRWRCSWEVLQPRNTTPLGRCHHSCCWHPGSRSLLVFGGYGDRQGCLSDVQVYNLDHREWWQSPGHAGWGPWPCCRRSHAAAVLDDGLWVHGGLDSGGRHLDDLWRLDLTTWTWQEVSGSVTTGACRPSSRRGHCLVAAQGRFLLLHGGYSGTCDLLGDAWVFCTDRACWLPVELTAAAGDQPVGRALHTITHVANRFMVVGGQTSLGPLSQMGMLCSPGVLHAQQWQQHSIEQCLQRLQLQQQNSQMQEQLHKLAAEAQQEKTGSRVVGQQAAAAEALAADISRDNAALHRAQATIRQGCS